MNITNTPIWERARPYLFISSGRNIELRRVPRELAIELLDVEDSCADCGAPMHPFKARGGHSDRPHPWGMYCVVTCCKPGCVRGTKATARRIALIADVSLRK